jgi:hypothetical protein
MAGVVHRARDVGFGSLAAAARSNRHVRYTSESRRGTQRPARQLRAMYGRRPRCKRNLTYLRSVRVQPCIRPVFAWRLAPIAMQPLWLLALM